MHDTHLIRERNLKERINTAIDTNDWASVYHAALALEELYSELEAEAHLDLNARVRWKALKEQWHDYARRLKAHLPNEHQSASNSVPPATVPPQSAADPIRAARVLGLAPSGSAPQRPDFPKTKTDRLSVKRREKTGEPDEDDEKPSWLLRERPNVSFDDIIGLEDLKQRIRRFVVKFKHPDEVAKWKGAKLGDRMLLYGPPGTGKTMFAKAVAKEIDADFYLVKGSNILSKWVGESQKNVHRLFEEVRKSKRAVVFLDEIDGMLSARGGSSSVRDGVVSEFLQEMEGLSTPNESVLFIGATNLPSELDQAVISRFGAMFYVPLPDYAARLALLQKGFSRFPYGVEPDVSLEQLAQRLEGHSMRAVQGLIYDLNDIGILKSTEGEQHRISNSDIEIALKNLPPPLSSRELEKYERYKR